MVLLALMSGTSVDACDAILCEVGIRDDGRLGANVLDFHEHPIPPDLRERIFEVFRDGDKSLSLACSLNFEIGELFTEAANDLLSKHVHDLKVDAVASHGQTLYHVAPHMAGAGRVASTLQLGEAAVIAEGTGLPVIADFRVADMAAGGNGAPLVPFADFHLFSREGAGVIVQNIGGIANGTCLSASGKLDDVIAFDTGPGNMIIDALVQHYFPGEHFDRNGEHGRKGHVIESLLAEWLAIPYISAKPPKTTGRELFGKQLIDPIISRYSADYANDLITTATEFTARSIAMNTQFFVLPAGPVEEMLVAGGGALNGYLVERLAHHLGELGVAVRLLDEAGFASKQRECLAFALLGYARLKEIPANVPSATGARHPAVLGKISVPSDRSL